jgi:hypothetical protein
MEITIDEYKKWLVNKNINPKTNRKIKTNSKIYNFYNSFNMNNYYIKETIDNKDPISLNDIWIEKDGKKKIVYNNINNLVFYTDSHNNVRCFEKESLSYLLGYGNKNHPITGEPIPESVFINITPSKVIKETSKTIEDITLDIFQLFNNQSVFIDHNLFLKLSKDALLKLYYETKDFYINNLTTIQRNEISSSAFQLNKDNLIEKNTNEIRKYILDNIKILLECTNDEYKFILLYILVGGLSTVIKEVKEQYPDLSFDFAV